MADQRQSYCDIDFDHWSGLAENNLSEFETLRRAAIDELIRTVPEDRRERLMRLQWRIDQERGLAGSALGACIRISKLMWEQLMNERGLLSTLAKPESTKLLAKADVIPLVKK